MHRRLALTAVLAAALLALPGAAFAAAPKPTPVTLSGVLFDNKANVKVSFKLGGSLRFVWKDGFHNVLTAKAPAKATKVNSGNPAEDHKPIVFKPTKKGTYVFYCAPHRPLGMVLTLTVK
jgi:plastocyanin